MKKLITYLSVTFLFTNNLCAGEGEGFSEDFDTFSSAKYNSLLSAEDADSSLSANKNFSCFFEKASILAQEYDFNSFLGLRLLHRHTELAGNDSVVLVENSQPDLYHTAFITKPYALIEKDAERFVPASWIPGDNGYTVFEYSKDEEAFEQYSKLIKKPDFFIKFHALLNQHELQNLIAPAIMLKGKLIEPSSNMNFVEESYENPFRSIVSYKSTTEYAENDLIKTSWPLPIGKELKCYTICSPGSSYCERHSKGHSIKRGHNRTERCYKLPASPR